MSPASLAAPAPSTHDTEQRILWCAASRGQVRAGLPVIQHLLRLGHRITLVTPEDAWEGTLEEAAGDDDATARVQELGEGGLRVVHPHAEPAVDARALLHSLHTDAEPDFTDDLLGDPRFPVLARGALVLWPGTTHRVRLDEAEVLTGDAAREATRELLTDAVAAGDLSPRQVLQLAREVPDAVTSRQRVDASTTLLRQGQWTGGTGRLQRQLRALAAPDLDGDDFTALVGLTFHRSLHADATSSPLVDNPGAWLSPLRSTARWKELTTEHRRTAVTPRPAAGTSPRVLLLPGTYGRFEQPVVQALQDAGCTVDLLDLTEVAPQLTSRLVRAESMEAVRRLVTDGEHGLPADVVDRIRRADVLWAEWADLPAVWLSHLAGEHQRLVLRVHSLDALDPWLHLVRWASVDALVAVGAPVARVALGVLGARTDLPPVHVIGHVVDDRWTAVPTTEDSHRRLVMVKWGRRVKDPLRALELLARLREHDPAWRLRLIGEHVSEAGEAGDYAQKFATRAAAEDVRGAIEYVPQTDDVAAHLSGCGFVLSTSRRESFHLGLVEAAASGCVPVVRDWPVFARRGGARDVVPTDWVVDGVDGAVERVLAHSDRATWEAESAATQRRVRDHFPADETRRRLAAVALDHEDPLR
ncbi:glycosyltransferase [Kytococcus sp. Marseille-QA3725]